MAYDVSLTNITLVAAEDLSAKQYFGITVDSNGKAAVADDGEMAIGVLQNNPVAGGEATVAVAGITNVSAGDTIAAGKPVAFDASGEAVVAVAASVDTSDGGAAADPVVGDFVFGIALATAADGDIIPVMITHSGFWKATA